ncbi:MAG: hypothetical protein M3Q44_06170 [bacterium]|nr:hypothetical protein [bacterium]
MTTTKAREIIEKQGLSLSDAEIERIVTIFEAIIELGFKVYERSMNDQE